MSNPALVEVFRGGFVESRHYGAYAVVGPQGQLMASAGAIDTPVFPRSAIKAFQALPLVEGGAADALGLTDEEIALTCSSHNGEEAHVRVARSILHKAGMSEDDLECGAHPPQDTATFHALVRAWEKPAAIHNNCSGKHAGMLALVKNLGLDPRNYVESTHPVQQGVARIIDELCAVTTASLPMAIDGCSVPTWAIPLRNLALGFQRLASGETLHDKRQMASRRIIAAVRAHPFMVAGSGRFCTELMAAVPRAFVKTGAEGVFCASIPHANIGIALKCDDGARRAAEVATAAVLATIDAWSPEEKARLREFTALKLKNWRNRAVGHIAAVAPLPMS